MSTRVSLVIMILIILRVFTALGITYSPSTIPDPKTTSLNSWIADPDHILTTREYETINRKISAISSKLQMGVVIVNEITSEFTPKQFVTETFNQWGIGQKKIDNGLLLLVVVKQKRWEIETGYGLEGEWPDVVIKRIGEKTLVPSFKEKKWAEGISKFIDTFTATTNEDLRFSALPASAHQMASDEHIKSVWVALAQPPETDQWIILAVLLLPSLIFYLYRKFKPSHFVWKRKTLFLYPFGGLIGFSLVGFLSFFTTRAHLIEVVKLMLIYFIIHTFLLAIFFILAFYNVSKYREVSKRLDVALSFFSKYGLFFAGSVGFWAVPLVDRLIRKARFSEHDCSHCQKIMNSTTDLITGKNENGFLDHLQRLEQTYEGLDYDVWKCTSCKNLSLYPIKLEKEGIEDCPQCLRRTFKYIRTQVLVAASVHSSGKGCNEFFCGACNHRLKKTYDIPIISSNASKYGSHQGFGSGTSGGSGTGWGGGRSGGGGAGGSW